MTKLQLQRIAMKAYAGGDMAGDKLTDHEVKEIGVLDGDTLALFVWYEVGNAKGDKDEAIRMINRAISELNQVIEGLEKT
jgi:hypothetical protein